MKELKLTKSQKLVQFQIAAVTILAVILVVLSFLLLRGTRELLGIEITLFGWILRILIITVAIGAVYATKLFAKHKTYTLKDNKLIISRSSFGPSKNKDVVKMEPDAIANINIQQSAIDKMLGVGTVAITIDSYSGKSIYRIEGIENPKQVLSWIEDNNKSNK